MRPSILVVQNAEWESPGLVAEYSRGARLKLSAIELFRNTKGAARIPFDGLDNGEYSAVVSLGSPSTVYLPKTNPRHAELVQLFKLVRRRKIPSFNVCYSMQLFCDVHGGKVAKNPAGKEVGFFKVLLTEGGKADPVIGPVGTHTTLQWHGDIVEDLPPGAIRLAYSSKTRNQVAVLDGIHYLLQSDGQAATPSMVETWMRKDGEWATEGTGVDAGGLFREAAHHEAYLRNTFFRIFGNFLALVLASP